MATVFGRVNFRPKPHQRAVMTDKKRHRGAVMHRRAGKTVMAIFDGLETQLSCPLPSPRVGYVAPFLKQAKKLAWDYLESVTRSGGRHFDINRSELTTTFLPNDGKFMLLGADNIDAIRGMYFDKIIVDELADCDPRLWTTVLRPALADRKGRALMMGTPRGRMNMLYDISQTDPDDPEWGYHCYDCTQTDMLDAAEIAAMRREMSEALFEQELMCSFNAALIGAVYGREMEALQRSGRFTKVRYDPQYPVFLVFDLGWRDATAVWYVQFIGTEIHAIEYEEFTMMSLVDVAKSIRAKPYVYGEGNCHFGPHDLWQHELGSGNTRIEILAKFEIEFEPAVNWPLEDGIEAVRVLLPHLWIDRQNGARGLECLLNYIYEFDKDQRGFKTRPLHNWASHGCDALRMLAVNLDKSVRRELPTIRRKSRSGDAQGWLI